MKKPKVIRVRGRKVKTKKPRLTKKISRKVRTKRAYTSRRPRFKDSWHKEE